MWLFEYLERSFKIPGIHLLNIFVYKWNKSNLCRKKNKKIFFFKCKIICRKQKKEEECWLVSRHINIKYVASALVNLYSIINVKKKKLVEFLFLNVFSIYECFPWLCWINNSIIFLLNFCPLLLHAAANVWVCVCTECACAHAK